MTTEVDRPAFTGERVVPWLPEHAELYREHLVRYLFATQFCRGQTVLDAGCGLGYGVDLLRRAGAGRIVGIDLSQEAIALARKHYDSRSPLFVMADGQALPFAGHCFDVAISFETIEHLQDPARFLVEVKRVLKPDGIAVISTPNRLTYPPGNLYHAHEFDQTEFEDLLRPYFSHIQMFFQDVVGANRIVPSVAGVTNLNHPDVFPAFDMLTLPSAPRFFVAVCSARPLIPQPKVSILRTAHHLGGDLQQHLANLEATLAHARQRNRDLGARYTSDTTQLQTHAANLSREIENLRAHCANLEDGLMHLGQWNTDLVTDQQELRRALEARRDAGSNSEDCSSTGSK